jgi:hypothetical protein
VFERRIIPVADLRIYERNPRLMRPDVGERTALRDLARHQKDRLPALATHIANHGLSPIDSLLVIPDPQDTKRYIVIEGNRRLCAIRALHDPDYFEGAITARALAKLRVASKVFYEHPIESIECIVVQNYKQAATWMEIRHIGGHEGAGTEGWGANEVSRYRARELGEVEPYRELLDRLEQDDYVSEDTMQSFNVSNFQRILTSPAVRERLGIDVKRGEVLYRAPWPDVAKALMYVIRDIASPTFAVGRIYYKEDREKYAQSIPHDVAVTLPNTKEEGAALGEYAPARQQVTRTKSNRSSAARVRTKLIPHNCSLSISEPRVKKIEAELRKLKVDDYPNAVSVLLRVFIELSVDHYIDRERLKITSNKQYLATRLAAVAEDLVAQERLKKQQAKPSLLSRKRSSLAPSISMMHEYVHNPYFTPAVTDLFNTWDDFQPFIVAIWSA